MKGMKIVSLKKSRSFRVLLFCMLIFSCSRTEKKTAKTKSLHASEILGNPDYLAISYGGYRTKSRDVQPTLEEIKRDLQLLYALGIRIVRTYNLELDFAPNVVKAIKELKKSDPSFEMYVMLGAWINCKNAWTNQPNHLKEDEVNNEKEILRAVSVANEYPDIVKIIAVGNEAMIDWATSYYVPQKIILKWVNHLQSLKKKRTLNKEVWITSSDDFASWGGGNPAYHNKDLTALMNAVDYISIHTYPFHNTHYNPSFWEIEKSIIEEISPIEHIEMVMDSAIAFADKQYQNVKSHMLKQGINKPIHIGETGWSTISDGFYGPEGSAAADEYKQALYYHKILAWSKENKVSCFYFSAFDEIWKDAANPAGSENHFGLFTVDGRAKFALWKEVDRETFGNLSRSIQEEQLTKTFSGDIKQLELTVKPPKTK